MAKRIGNGRAHLRAEQVQRQFDTRPETEEQSVKEAPKCLVCVLGVKSLVLFHAPHFLFFHQIARRHWCRAQFFVKLPVLGQKVELDAKETGRAQGFTFRGHILDVPAQGTLALVNTKHGLEGRRRFFFGLCG